MRFVLDGDVDVAVALALRAARHECWTVNEAGLAGRIAAVDDELAVYARHHDAAVVSHVRGVTRRRARRPVGRHVWLRCPPPDAAELVRRQLVALVAALAAAADVVVAVGDDGVSPLGAPAGGGGAWGAPT